MGVPEVLVTHGVEEPLRVAELDPVLLLLLEQSLFHGRLAEVKYVVVGCAEEDVVGPTIEYRWGELEVTAVQLLQHGVVAIEAVGGDGDYVVSSAQAEVLRQLDGAKDVADGGWPEGVPQAERQFATDAQLDERVRAIVENLDALTVSSSLIRMTKSVFSRL